MATKRLNIWSDLSRNIACLQDQQYAIVISILGLCIPLQIVVAVNQPTMPKWEYEKLKLPMALSSTSASGRSESRDKS